MTKKHVGVLDPTVLEEKQKKLLSKHARIAWTTFDGSSTPTA